MIRAIDIDGLADLRRAARGGDPGVTIAILDGLVDRDHPCLRGARLRSIEPPWGAAALDHGTLIASLIFGRPGSLVEGIAPECSGLILPVFRRENGESRPRCSQLDLARAVEQAMLAGADVINISGGESGAESTAHPLLVRAISSAVSRGILVVGAVGNDGCACPNVPAAIPGVLAIGAMGLEGHPLESSNWGRDYDGHGLIAPGAGLLGAAAAGGTTLGSGSSLAAAVVSGVAGLMLAAARRAGRSINGSRIREILLDTARRCQKDLLTCKRSLNGRIDISRAMIALLGDSGFMSEPFAAEVVLSDTNDATGATMPSMSVGATPSDCGCESCRSKASPEAPGGLVFALGTVSYDLVSEARRDSLKCHMGDDANPHDPAQLIAYLEANPWESSSVIWTLKLDQTPIYAIAPSGPFAAEAYKRLVEFLKDAIDEEIEIGAIPGRISGSVRLLHGQVVPVIVPEIRGMASWTPRALIDAINAQTTASGPTAPKKKPDTLLTEAVRDFLDRVYYELRNLGVVPQDRAINYSATNAVTVEKIFEKTVPEHLELDTIEVERSTACRPESDCWDVKLFFFKPDSAVHTVRKVFRFTVDVSDVVPVMVGPIRSWSVR